MHACDGQTDGRTDRRTDGQTDRILIARPRLHCMQRGKNEQDKALYTLTLLYFSFTTVCTTLSPACFHDVSFLTSTLTPHRSSAEIDALRSRVAAAATAVVAREIRCRHRRAPHLTLSADNIALSSSSPRWRSYIYPLRLLAAIKSNVRVTVTSLLVSSYYPSLISQAADRLSVT